MALPIYAEVEEGTERVHEEWYEKTMLLALDEGDTITPTERELMAEEGNKGESEQEEVLLAYKYISWSDMCRGHLTKSNMRIRLLL